jgi:hypothetical protein
MMRKRTPYPLHSMLTRQGEPTLRYLAELCIKRAERLDGQDAAIERERARRYLEAAEARAEEKSARKEARRKRGPALPVFS